MAIIVNPDGTKTTWEPHEGPMPEWKHPELEPVAVEPTPEPEKPAPRRRATNPEPEKPTLKPQMDTSGSVPQGRIGVEHAAEGRDSGRSGAARHDNH